MTKWCLACVAMAGTLCAVEPPALRNSYHPAVVGGMNVWVDAALLYWKPWEKALVATNKKSDVFVTDDFTQHSVVHPHFKWEPGYRISSGYLFSSHLWDVEGSFTHFTSHVSQRRSSHGSAFIGMFPIWSRDVMAGDYVFESNLQWKLTTNWLDLQFGRYLNTCHWLDLKPFLGVRSAWIKQHGDVVYKGGIFLIGIVQPGVSLNGSDLIKMENNYWGLGPKAGLAPRFIIGRGLSLNAEAAFSGLYGFFKIRQKETYLDATRSSYHAHLNRFRWIGDFSLGLQWKTLLHHQRYALTLKADWEYHILFHQFELKKDDFGLIPNNRDLSVQGVAFSARFDF